MYDIAGMRLIGSGYYDSSQVDSFNYRLRKNDFSRHPNADAAWVRELTIDGHKIRQILVHIGNTDMQQMQTTCTYCGLLNSMDGKSLPPQLEDIARREFEMTLSQLGLELVG